MNSRKKPLDIEDSVSDFSRLLREVLAHRAPLDELFADPLFNSRLRLITRAYARTTEDAEELAYEVRDRVWQNLWHFHPDYRNPYDNFFSWLRALTHDAYLNILRERDAEFDDQRVEDLDIADTKSDIEDSVLYKEVMAEFEECIKALPERERLAVTHYLQGFSFRERATRAKREFHTILEQVINSDTPAITPEDILRTRFASFVGDKTSETTQSSSRPGWVSANDLLRKMQSPESKQGIQAAFQASPEELGRAAVEHANKGHKVPVSSLTTYLMAASTVNVVERVMNLTKDAT